jgi:hypothetical protein
MKALTSLILVGLLFLAACTATPSGSSPTPVNQTVVENTVTSQPTEPTQLPRSVPTKTPVEILTPREIQVAATETPAPTATLSADGWKTLPVIPVISPKVLQIYQRGLELGNNPAAFSKIGDCGSTPAWFLGDFDRGPKFYRLGEYAYLQAVIQEFQGSYARTSLAAKSGFNVSSVLSPFWSDAQQCLADEPPVACEVRVHKPMFAFIMLGTNDVYHLESFEQGMRQVLEFLIENGVVPILSTKADNLEGNEIINATIARLASEYEVPLLNYWQALQSLPNQGLQEDKAHITYGQNHFDDPGMMETGWTVRNLTALQALDAVWKATGGQP